MLVISQLRFPYHPSASSTDYVIWGRLFISRCRNAFPILSIYTSLSLELWLLSCSSLLETFCRGWSIPIELLSPVAVLSDSAASWANCLFLQVEVSVHCTMWNARDITAFFSRVTQRTGLLDTNPVAFLLLGQKACCSHVGRVSLSCFA